MLGACWISRRYKRALTGTANGGRHKAMPCLAEEVLKAPVGQPAFQQLKGGCCLSAQEPASVSGPGVWRGASGSMLAPYDGERRVRSEGQKGREAFYVYISSLQYSEGKSAQ